MAAGRLPAAAPTASLRAKFLLIVVLGGVFPLAVVGLWLTRTAQGSGRALLRSRLDSALVRTAQEVGDRWVSRRSALLLIAEDSSVRSALAIRNTGRDGVRSVALPALTPQFADLRDATQLLIVSDARHLPLWILDADAAGTAVLVAASDSLRVGGAPLADVLTIRIAITGRGATDTLGVLEARFRAGKLVPAVAGSAAGAGAVFAVVDRATQTIIVPLPFDPALLRNDRFTWGGEEWLTARRDLDDPRIELLAAAPSSAFTLPFEDAARYGLLALAFVTLVAVAVTTLLTRRVTRSLVELADAAEAVSRGDLDRRIESHARDEVGRLARAFNAMTESLRRTLSELSQRQAVAAVGEFASALAHEIRNPLTAMRLNLQHVEEQLSSGSPQRERVTNALRDIDRLDGTVAGALRVARTGRMEMAPVELRGPLEAAMRGAGAAFANRQAILERLPSAPALGVHGNSDALEQLFLNLLLNAAQACAAGNHAGVRLDAAAGRAAVTVWDEGSGFAPTAKGRAFEPFFTTKAEGTGLGLTVAQRIVAAHGGIIAIESEPGTGTRVRVELPLARTPSAARGPGAGHG